MRKVLAALVALTVLSVALAGAEPSPQQLRARLQRVFSELLKVEELGLNVSSEISLLNEALALIRKFESGRGTPEDLDRANAILDAIESRLPQLMAKAEQERRAREVMLAVQVAGIVALVIVVVVLAPRAAWLLWYRLRRDWLVVSS